VTTYSGDWVGVRWQSLETFAVLHIPDTNTLIKLHTDTQRHSEIQTNTHTDRQTQRQVQDFEILLYTHPFNGPFSGTTQVGRYQKGKTNLDFTEARDSEWQWHQLGRMQVCTSLQTDNHASTSPLSFFTGRMPFLPPNQQRQSTEGKIDNDVVHKSSTDTRSSRRYSKYLFVVTSV